MVGQISNQISDIRKVQFSAGYPVYPKNIYLKYFSTIKTDLNGEVYRGGFSDRLRYEIEPELD